MAPFLPIRAFNRSAAVRIGGQKILPGQTYWIDLGATGVPKEFASHSSIGQVYPVGPLSYRNGGGLILSNALTANQTINGTTETLDLNLSIPANFLAVGSVLDIEAMGTVTAATATTFAALTRLGTAGTIADALASTTSVGSITTAQTWRLDVEGEVRTLGSGTAATISVNSRLTIGASLAHGTATVTSFDSTVGQFVDLSFSATGGTTQVITVTNSNLKIFQ